MDWQVIVLTLGASLITGAISLIGNILVSRSNLKKIKLENEEQNKKEHINRKVEAYSKILHQLAVIDVDINKDINNRTNLSDILLLEKCWLENYPNCSQEVNRNLSDLFRYFSKEDSSRIKLRIDNIRKQIKKDLDSLYGIKEESKDNYYKFKSKYK